MLKTKPIVLFWLLLLPCLLFLVGCSGTTPDLEPNESPSVDGELVIPEVAQEEIQETAEGGEVLQADPSEEIPSMEEVADQPEGPNTCLDCHTDQQMLTDTAKPEEVVVSESEGEG